MYSTVPVTILNTKIIESFLEVSPLASLTQMLESNKLEIGSYEWTYPCYSCDIKYRNLLESQWYGE